MTDTFWHITSEDCIIPILKMGLLPKQDHNYCSVWQLYLKSHKHVYIHSNLLEAQGYVRLMQIKGHKPAILEIQASNLNPACLTIDHEDMADLFSTSLEDSPHFTWHQRRQIKRKARSWQRRGQNKSQVALAALDSFSPSMHRALVGYALDTKRMMHQGAIESQFLQVLEVEDFMQRTGNHPTTQAA